MSELDLDEAAFEAALKNTTEDDEVVEQVEPEPEEEAEAQPAAEEPEPEKEPEPEPAKTIGVASKDGKTVLPYVALKGARDETKQERAKRVQAEAERDELKQQLEDLKAGKTEPDEYAELVEEFPAAAKLVERIKDLQGQLKVKVVPTETIKEPAEDPQEAIDSVPLLAEWQASDQEKWSRAIAIDNALKDSPKWKSKPLEARFAHVAQMVADEFDIQTEEDKTSPAPRASRQDPDEVVKEAKRLPPSTLSDFKSGSVVKTDNVDRMSPQKMASMVERMSNAEYQDWLDKQG